MLTLMFSALRSSFRARRSLALENLALRQQIARAVAQLFDGYQPGLNPDEVPPLLGYEVVEKNIHERDWK